MNSAEVPEKVRSLVTGREEVTALDLEEGLGLSRRSARVYLSRLAGAGVVSRVGRSTYATQAPAPLAWEPTPRMREVGKALIERLYDLEPVVWSTELAAAFSHYALGKPVIFVEVKPRRVSMVRDTLVQAGQRPILKGDFDNLADIFGLFDEPLLVLGRSERYATVMFEGFRVPSPERLVVDLYYWITRLALPFPPGEVGRILYNLLLSRSPFNFSRCLRYASRRRLRDEWLIIFYRLAGRYPELKIPSNLFIANPPAREAVAELVEGASP